MDINGLLGGLSEDKIFVHEEESSILLTKLLKIMGFVKLVLH